jgi:hypothetical protein
MEKTDLEFDLLLEKEIDAKARELFRYIVRNGPIVFREGYPLFKYKETDILDRLVKYFENLEEYEKCHRLVELKRFL